ncbi:hypothetical protein [Afipia carboxidovorans]|uniref:hypothetical protein n=1 Tax=Afipia carboxidovorans TaxID=40137 RepID=UPI00308D008F|nr:hypothetical protein CRBSH125_21920 [Afipia carboxidovorans]
MQDHEVRKIVAEVLAEQQRLHNANVDNETLRTISTILTSFGIEEEDRIELRADFQHLRRWRKASEQVSSYGLKAAVTILVSGIAGAIWLGIKTRLGQ